MRLYFIKSFCVRGLLRGLFSFFTLNFIKRDFSHPLSFIPSCISVFHVYLSFVSCRTSLFQGTVLLVRIFVIYASWKTEMRLFLLSDLVFTHSL